MLELDQLISRLVGPYIASFYEKVTTFERVWQAVGLARYHQIRIIFRRDRIVPEPETSNQKKPDVEQPLSSKEEKKYKLDKSFGKEEMLRDMFLWSVHQGYVDIAFVLLLQLKSRIGASLLAASVAKRLSFVGRNLHVRNMYDEHRKAYEEYATTCINACYKCNEHFSCQLLLREIPLLGNITCMQVSRRFTENFFTVTDIHRKILSLIFLISATSLPNRSQLIYPIC